MSGLTSVQARASAPHSSSFLTASAGTGKTHVLIARMVRLMLAGAKAESILCLTFTKAAAAEMKTRLFDELGNWTTLNDSELAKRLKTRFDISATPELLLNARRMFAETLDLADRLRIQTFHSFCQSLLGRFPLEAGLLPGFKAMEETESRSIMADARDNTLERALGDKALANTMEMLARRLTEQSFDGLMQGLKSNATSIAASVRRYGDFEHYRAALATALDIEGETPESLSKAAIEACPLERSGFEAFISAMQSGTVTDKKMIPHIEGFLSKEGLYEDQLSALQGWILTSANTPRAKLITAGTLKKFPQLETDLNALLDWFLYWFERIEKWRLLDQSIAVTRIGLELFESYENEKRFKSLVDFEDMVNRSVNIIAGQNLTPWILYKLDGEISHILIDEAQDTNEDQWSVVESISEEFFAGLGASDEERTIFAVGDEKQSIYSFQGADPAQFLRARKALGDRARQAEKSAETITMDLSFRSTRAVLDIVDHLFNNVFSARQGVVFDETIMQHHAARVGDGGQVRLLPLFTENADPIEEEEWTPPISQQNKSSAEERAAHSIAREIRKRIDNKEILPSKGRPLKAGDFLILVRRRTPFTDIISRYLQSLGVAVAGRDRMKLTEEIPVMDLLALAESALAPDDDLKLATVLKGPFIGISEQDLFDLAYDRKGKSLIESLIKSTDNITHQKALSRFNALTEGIDQKGVYDFFAEILESFDGRAILETRLGEEVHEPLNAVLDMALAYDHSEAKGMYGFLVLINKAGSDIKRELDQTQDQVRIMTVHSAKGLQAPIVYLADTTSEPKVSLDTQIINWQPYTHRPSFLLWTQNRGHVPLIQSLKEERKIDLMAEYNRLLYVALTRAEDQLNIVGWKGPSDLAKTCWYMLIEKALSDFLGIEPDASEALIHALAQEKPVEAQPQKSAAIPPIAPPKWLLAPAPQEATPPNPLRPSDIRDSRYVSPLELLVKKDNQNSSLQRGKVIHGLLEWLPSIEAGDRAEVARLYLQQKLEDTNAADALADKLMALFENDRLTPLWHHTARAEVSLTGMIGATPISGRIDRLLMSDTEIVFADYKTGYRVPEKADDIPAETIRQMALYSGILSEISPETPIKALLIYTEGPEVYELSQDVLGSHLAREISRAPN